MHPGAQLWLLCGGARAALGAQLSRPLYSAPTLPPACFRTAEETGRWEHTTQRSMIEAYTDNATLYRELHPGTSIEDAAERALVCSTVWNRREQRRKSAACNTERSFREHWRTSESEALSPNAWCASFVRAFHGRTLTFLGDSISRQQYAQLCCSCRDFLVLHPRRKAHWHCHSGPCLNGMEGFYLVELQDAASGSRCTVQYLYHTGRAPRHVRTVLPLAIAEAGDRVVKSNVIALGLGAWIASGTQHNEREWKATLEAATTVLGTVGFRGVLLWMEYFAGHFGSPTGEWGKLAKNATRCQPVSRASASANVGTLAGNRWAQALPAPIWHTARVSLDRHMDHPGSRAIERDLDNPGWGAHPFAAMFDCRHFCAPPSSHSTATCALASSDPNIVVAPFATGFPGATLEARNKMLLPLLRTCVRP